MLGIFSGLTAWAALQPSFAVRDTQLDMKLHILENSSLETKPKVPNNEKCTFGTCDEITNTQGTFLYCYEWKNNAFTCGGVKPGGVNGNSGYIGSVLYGSKRAVTHSVSRECANYRNIPHFPGGDARQWLPPSQAQVVNWAHFVHVPEIRQTSSNIVQWVTVTNSFGTVTMNGCTIVSKWDAANNVWKVAHLRSNSVYQLLPDEDVNVMFPNGRMVSRDNQAELNRDVGRNFWVWGQVDIATGGLAIYVGVIQGDATVLAQQNIGLNVEHKDATYQTVGLSFTECLKVVFARR